MTSQQMIDRAKRAERLCERFVEIERDNERSGFYEQALEARRMRLEQESAAAYWRSRACGGARV